MVKKKRPCSPDSLAARFIGKGDAIFNKDNSEAVDKAIPTLEAKLHYSAARAVFAMEEESYLGPLKPAKDSLWNKITGDFADIKWHPNEVLGDDITEQVLEAYDKYAGMVAGEFGRNQMPSELEKGQQEEALKRFRVDSGLNKALMRAEVDVKRKFKNDPDRMEYAESWIRQFRGGRLSASSIDRLIDAGTSNLSRNLLMNNMRAAMQNFTQTATTTLPEFGFENTFRGMQAYQQAVKTKDPELQEAQIGKSRFYEDKWTKFDMFAKPEGFNQGVTYYAAKMKAIAEGKTESEAKKVAKNAIQTYQFKHRAGNEPRHYWGAQGKTQLSLLSYGIQMRRLYHGWWGDWIKSVGTKNAALFQESSRKILYFIGANALLNGSTADIPEEFGAALKYFAPNVYKALRSADQWSVFGMLDVDTAELARIPLTGWGLFLKVPVLWDSLGDLLENIDRALTHPTEKSIINAVKTGAMLAPAVPIVGNKNLGKIVEYVYRSTFGDWTKYTHTGKKYQSDPVTEGKGILTGPSFRKNIDNM